MNANIKRRWINALTSDKFKQATDVLHRVQRLKDGKSLKEPKHSFCCLGVLCELAVKDGIIKAFPLSTVGDSCFNYGKRRAGAEGTILPPAVVKWSGLPDNVGIYFKRGGESSLTLDNDSGMSFKRISNIIKKHF